MYAIILSCVLLCNFTNISFAEALEAEIDTSELEGKNIECTIKFSHLLHNI